ncbi:DUF5753 domain-containing protein [Spirillospora sp. NPDC050679]
MPLRESLDPDSSMWHWIAVDLHFYRVKHELSCAQLGRVLNCARQTVSNIEAARPGYRLDDEQAAALDRLWSLNGHFQRLLRYARAGHDPDWFKHHVGYEQRARVIRQYAAMVVPGLLQTEAYARAWLRCGIGAVDIEAALAVRLGRQKILTVERPPLLRFLLDEALLIRPLGGVDVMRGQLAHLLQVAELDNVSIRVVPLSAGGHLGLEGPFILTTVEEGEVAYLEACAGGRLAVDRAEVRGFAIRYDQIGDLALPVGASRSLIADAMERMK